MLRIYVCVILSFACWGLNTAASEIKVAATTPSVALFKNGVTVVQQEIEVPTPGEYCWDDVPPVIHGTFFIESDLNIEIRTTQRLVSVPIDERNQPQGINDFAGKMVTVRFSDKSVERGKVVNDKILPETNSLLTGLTQLPQPRSSYPYYLSPVNPTVADAPVRSSFMLEDSDKKYMFLTGQQISLIKTDEPITERVERRPVMLFNVTAKDGKTAGKIRLFYLTKGATWAPSYRVDLLDTKRLRIEQSALIRNEWSALRDTEISLVSGFPQIETSQILSPLNPTQTLERFFQQIMQQENQRRYGNNDVSYMSNSGVIAQNAVHPASVADAGFDTTALAAGEGPDIYYNNVGKKTLDVGDTLSLSTGKGEADYRRILECDLVPLFLNDYDHIRYNWNDRQARDRLLTPDVFDVLKFQNPLPFPMTTAPATVTEKAKFLGQSQSNWVNPNQVASIKITKVMNVRVTYSDQIQKSTMKSLPDPFGSATKSTSEENTLFFRGDSYIKQPLTGTIEIVNQRNEEITLHLNSVYIGVSGTEKIEPPPTKQSVSPRDYMPNDITDLFWELQLKPGEKKTIIVSGFRWIRR